MKNFFTSHVLLGGHTFVKEVAMRHLGPGEVNKVRRESEPVLIGLWAYYGSGSRIETCKFKSYVVLGRLENVDNMRERIKG